MPFARKARTGTSLGQRHAALRHDQSTGCPPLYLQSCPDCAENGLAGVRWPSPETIPRASSGTHRVLRIAGIVWAASQLWFYGRIVTAEFGCEGNRPPPPTDVFLFSFLAWLQTDPGIRRLKNP